MRSRCVLKDFATTVRDDVFAPTPSPLSVRGLLLHAAWFDLRVETGDLVCACMQAFARPPKGQERDGWIWRLHGAMNGMRTASRDITEFLAGILTEHGLKHVANWSDVCLRMSRSKHVWYLVWTTLSSVPSQQRLKNSGCRSQRALNPCVLSVYLGFEYRSVHEGERRGFTLKPTAKYVDGCLDIVQVQSAKAVITPLTEQKSMNLHDELLFGNCST